jgi:hypothetical protein
MTDKKQKRYCLNFLPSVPIRSEMYTEYGQNIRVYRACDVLKALKISNSGEIFQAYKISPLFLSKGTDGKSNPPYIGADSVITLILKRKIIPTSIKAKVKLAGEKCLIPFSEEKVFNETIPVKHFKAFPTYPVRVVTKDDIEYYCLTDVLKALTIDIKAPNVVRNTKLYSGRRYRELSDDQKVRGDIFFLDAGSLRKFVANYVFSRKCPLSDAWNSVLLQINDQVSFFI